MFCFPPETDLFKVCPWDLEVGKVNSTPICFLGTRKGVPTWIRVRGYTAELLPPSTPKSLCGS